MNDLLLFVLCKVGLHWYDDISIYPYPEASVFDDKGTYCETRRCYFCPKQIWKRPEQRVWRNEFQPYKPDSEERPMSGVERIAAERQRQIEKCGWTPTHDDEHNDGSLVDAASCYLIPRYGRLEADEVPHPINWPWGLDSWRPSPEKRIRELEKAGALIAAEIDRLERAGH